MTARADSKERRTKMAKFKAGDVVEIISGLNKGERGTVGSPNEGTENGKTLVSVYGDIKYIVPEDSLRLANAARNAKFKVGDKVKVKNPPHHTSDEVGVIKKISGTGRPGDPVMAEVHYGEGATWGSYGVIYASPSIMRLANSRTPRSSNAVVRNALAAIGSGIEAANARTARNATMGEIKAQLNPAKVKEAYQLLRKAADALDRCIPALKASNIAKAWPRMAEMYGEARSKLINFMAQFEGELQDMIR